MKYTHTQTDIKIENEFPKLIRDLIPDIIKKRGKIPKIRVAKNENEFRDFLLRKFVEEATELKNAGFSGNRQNLVEELADLFELIDTLLELEGLEFEDVKKIQAEKSKERGGFKEKIIALEKV